MEDFFRIKLHKLLFYTVILISASSCGKKFDFGYESDRTSYLEMLTCFRNNYSIIFNARDSESSISYSPLFVTKNAFCGDLHTLMQKHQIEFVNFDRDSTVTFYSIVQHGIKNRQYILMFIPRLKSIHDKISTDIEIVKKKDSNCYELVKVISLAN